uniref:5-HT1D n=1 Tax=Sinonovacula constricta TaxID=98310 RepID=A0AA95Z9M6_SINCO|nr:5-HT1D [Sinonovacula constricta]
MPISLVKELSMFWYLGNALCDFWISVDVLCCTASILHLVAISLDRFWGVSNIDYIRRRCAKQILLMIAAVWFVAFTISIPPLFGWKDAENSAEKDGICQISQDLGYTVFSTVGAFYFPLFLMVFLNFKIYVAARSRIRKKNFTARPSCTVNTMVQQTEKHAASSCSDDEGYTVYNGSAAVTAINEEMQMSDGESGTPLNSGSITLQIPPSTSNSVSLINYKKINGHTKIDDINRRSNNTTTTHTNGVSKQGPLPIVRFHENNNHKHELQKLKKKRRDADRKRKDKMEMKRERKAAKVLGIITGAFIACWLPFFALAVIMPFCGNSCYVPPMFISFCLWLGYANSSLNPILYTIFNPSFRKAFHKIIYGKYRIRR